MTAPSARLGERPFVLERHALALPRPRALSTATLLVFAGSFAVVLMSRYRLSSDGFMTLFAGREVATHGMPAHDVLSVEGHGLRWIDQQWLAQWLSYRVWSAAGYAGLATVSAALVASAYALLARILLSRGASLRRALKWTTLALAVALPDIAIRAQQFAFPCFALLVWLLVRDFDAPSARRPAAAIAVLVLWGNLHGSVLLGAALVGSYCLWRGFESRRAGYFLFATAAAAAVAATPYGIDTLSYYRSTLGNGAIRGFASEWQPASPTQLAAVAFFVLVAAAGYVAVRAWRAGARPARPLAIATVALTAAGFAALRWEGFAAFLLVIVATDLLNVVEPAQPSRAVARIGPAAVAGVVLLLGGSLAAVATRRAAAFESAAPVGAAEAAARYAQSHPAAKVLADDLSASAILWLHPDLRGRVALDDRLELYPQRTVRAWSEFIRGRRSPLARRYQLVIAARSNRGLVRRLRAEPGRRLVYSDPTGLIFVRRRAALAGRATPTANATARMRSASAISAGAR